MATTHRSPHGHSRSRGLLPCYYSAANECTDYVTDYFTNGGTNYGTYLISNSSAVYSIPYSYTICACNDNFAHICTVRRTEYSLTYSCTIHKPEYSLTYGCTIRQRNHRLAYELSIGKCGNIISH